MSAKKASPGRKRLLTAAIDLFAGRWYEAVSIVEICKQADLSNGAFYKHFPNKETIFLTIVETFLEKFEPVFQSFDGVTVPERLEEFYCKLLTVNREERDLIQIFREAELKYPEFEKRLREIYMNALEVVFGRPISEAEYLYAIAGVRFMVRRPVFNEEHVSAEMLAKYVLNGLFPEPAEHPSEDRYLTIPNEPAMAFPGDSTKHKLIMAGLELFGKKGYHVVNVFEIAQQAGFSVGTFYLHFSSKEVFLVEVIRHISLEIRWYIALRAEHTLPRLHSEILALRLFLNFFLSHKEYYQIAREAEFTPTEAMDEYYDGFEQAYIQTFKNESIENPRVVAAYLMGIAHYMGIDYVFSRTVDDVVSVLREFVHIFEHGLTVE